MKSIFRVLAIATFIVAVFDNMDEDHEEKRWKEVSERTRKSIQAAYKPASDLMPQKSRKNVINNSSSEKEDDSLRWRYDRNHPDYDPEHDPDRDDEWHDYFND